MSDHVQTDRDEHDEDGALRELSWLGNVDNGNKVGADHLDKDARQHLGDLEEVKPTMPTKSEAPAPAPEEDSFTYDFTSDEEEKVAKTAHAARLHAEPAAAVLGGQRQWQRALGDVAPVDWAPGTDVPDFLGGPAVAPAAAAAVNVPKALGKIFVAIIEQMKAEGEMYLKTLPRGTPETTYFRLFAERVPSGVKDYSLWVPRHREMWLKEVMRCANYGYYESADAFMADIKQIEKNCQIYNDPETGGPHKTPSYIEYAKGMVEHIKGKLQARAKNIDRALGKVSAPPAAKRFKHLAPQPQAPAAAVDVVDFDPSANSLAMVPPRPAQGKKGRATQKQRAVGQGSPAVANAGPNFPISWAMCEKCRAWRTVDLNLSKSIIWECSMTPGFTCATPLEPGASYEPF